MDKLVTGFWIVVGMLLVFEEEWHFLSKCEIKK
jgi:hypothetical protein